MSDSDCRLCGGLIAQPGQSYGYSGQVCHCGDAWDHYAAFSSRLVDSARMASDLAAPAMSAVDLGASAKQTRIARAKLFGTGFAQVIFVAANTVFIAHYELLANLITAFLISIIWTWNVKKVAFGDAGDRWAYATGAALGSVAGTIIATRLLSSLMS